MSKAREIADLGDVVTVDSTGNVGIGTSSIDNKVNIQESALAGRGASNGNTSLTLEHATDTGIQFFSATQTQLRFGDATSTGAGSIIYEHGGDNLRVSTNSTEAMRIDSSGNVGIGTSSPSDSNGFGRALDVSGTTGAALYLRDGTDGDVGIFGQFDNATSINSKQADGIIVMYTGSSNNERMRIDSSGYFLVNRNASSGTIRHELNFSPTSEIAVRYHMTDTTYNNALMEFIRNDGTRVGYIYANGSSTSYNTSSDYRLKTDAQPMTGASARVQALNPVNFEWLSDGTRVDGFLAHEAQAVVPEAVTGTKDAMRDEEYEVTPAVLDNDGNVVTEAVMGTRSVPDYQGIDQSKLVPLLTAALQEALTKIDDMETRLAALEAV